MINIDELIKNSMKSRNKVELQAYQNLKAEIQKFKTAKNAKPYDQNSETKVISKYCKSLEDAIEQFSEANRKDLVSSYTSELEVLKKLLPAPVEPEDIEYRLYNWADELNFMDYSEEDFPRIAIPKKEMGAAIKHMKMRFPTANGKIISDIVKKYIV